jgi:hypothetical protein
VPGVAPPTPTTRSRSGSVRHHLLDRGEALVEASFEPGVHAQLSVRGGLSVVRGHFSGSSREVPDQGVGLGPPRWLGCAGPPGALEQLAFAEVRAKLVTPLSQRFAAVIATNKGR